MKTVLFLLLLPFTLSAQDSTVVLNVSLQARIIEYLTPTMVVVDNEERFNVFLKWRTLIRASKATGTTAVITDTIPTALLASLYNQVLSGEEALGIAAFMKTQIAAKRTANSYLDRLCTSYEQAWAARLTDRRLIGRKLLLGK